MSLEEGGVALDVEGVSMGGGAGAVTGGVTTVSGSCIITVIVEGHINAQ